MNANTLQILGLFALLLNLSLGEAGAFVGKERALGHAIRDQFQFRANYTNLNHGSYGAPPTVVTEGEAKHAAAMEMCPDYWFRFDGEGSLFDSLNLVRRRIARFINAESEDIVFVDNASEGVNSVLRSIRLPEKAGVLLLNVAYTMVKNTAKFVHEHEGAKVHTLDIPVPFKDSDIINLIETYLDSNPDIKLASFSHITSIPAVILPVKELVRICRSRDVLVLIDGAHALGQIDIDITDIDADFYIANGHKWLYSAKGSAILWVRRALQSMIHPVVISYEGKGLTDFQLQFEYLGTKDYSPFLSMGDALDFRESLGEKRIKHHIHKLARRGGALLAATWGTEKLVEDDQIGAMVNVRLPDKAIACCGSPKNQVAGGVLPRDLFRRYNTWVPIFPWSGKCYVRVSSQIYLEESDFDFLSKAVLQLIEDIPSIPDCIPM